MGHAYTMRLHGVAMAIVVVANLWLVEICHFALAARVHAAVLERILKLVGQTHELTMYKTQLEANQAIPESSLCARFELGPGFHQQKQGST
eukprot:1159386-Pelagomonas_calceolata.AAC.7